jgi:hypothetical protein
LPYDPEFINNRTEFEKCLHDVLPNSFGNTLIINYHDSVYSDSLMDILIKTGNYQKNVNIFWVYNFLGLVGIGYLSVFAVYVRNLVYFPHACIVITTVCNLNCKYCLNFQAFVKNQVHRSLEELKNDIDAFFAHVDRVGRLHISGGEPLLYPQLAELIQYIYDRYGSRIECLMATTNGKIVPSDQLCQILKNCSCEVWPANYLDGLPSLRPTYERLVTQAKKYGIYRQVFADKEWFFKIFPPARSYANENESSLIDKFNKCANYWRGVSINDRHIEGCLYVSFAMAAGLITREESQGEFLNLSEMSGSEIDKRIIVEYRLGYSDKGYNEFCKWCDGRELADKWEKVPAGTQEKGWLKWDRCNPAIASERTPKDDPTSGWFTNNHTEEKQ